MNCSITGKNLRRVVNSSSDRTTCSFRCTIWPLQSTRSIRVNEILISLSGVIQAQRTEFEDRYVSTLANLSVLIIVIIFQPIKKNFGFFLEHNDFWSCNEVYVCSSSKISCNVSFQLLDNPNHQDSLLCGLNIGLGSLPFPFP